MGAIKYLYVVQSGDFEDVEWHAVCTEHKKAEILSQKLIAEENVRVLVYRADIPDGRLCWAPLDASGKPSRYRKEEFSNVDALTFFGYDAEQDEWTVRK